MFPLQNVPEVIVRTVDQYWPTGIANISQGRESGFSIIHVCQGRLVHLIYIYHILRYIFNGCFVEKFVFIKNAAFTFEIEFWLIKIIQV